MARPSPPPRTGRTDRPAPAAPVGHDIRAPRPAPPARRSTGTVRPNRGPSHPGPSYGRRRLVVLAAVVTVLVVVAFGASRLLGGGDDGGGTTAATTDVPAVVDHSLFMAGSALGQGVGMRNLHDQYLVRDAIDRVITVVYVDRTELAGATGSATGERADALAAAIGAEDRLLDALKQWRDAVFNLRFAQVGPAETAVTDAMTALAAARDAWTAAGTGS